MVVPFWGVVWGIIIISSSSSSRVRVEGGAAGAVAAMGDVLGLHSQ